MVLFKYALGLCAATAVISAAPASLAQDRPEQLLVQDTVNASLAIDLGERGPTKVFRVPPTIIVPKVKNIQVGERPYFLVNNMTDSPLKEQLAACSEDPLRVTQFAISHRGAPLQFPEHTIQGVRTAARHGAGIVECDVSFTKDRKLVCRHSQCDLHTSTNILAIPELAAKCNQTFVPASEGKPASAYCCTSDITLAEFKSLCGKQDGFNASAATPEDYLNGTPTWRTELYDTCGQLMSHEDYIKEVDALGLSFTSEAKEPVVAMPFEGDYTQEQFLDQIIGEFTAAKVHPSRVWLQSFRLSDVVYWVQNEPEFGRQAIYLDDRTNTPEGLANATALETMKAIAAQGVQIIAPSFPWLLMVDNQTREIVPSEYALNAKEAGLKIITWSLERSGPLAKVAVNKDSYYTTLYSIIKSDGQLMEVVHALASKVKVLGIFSDWPATVSYYANCFGLLGGYQDPDRN
ncbi:hypothetical protein ACQY0O_001143 [Thecaphora frezii]